MLHDMEESKRTNNLVGSAVESLKKRGHSFPSSGGDILTKYGMTGGEIDFAIISDNYWPQLNQFEDDDDFQPHTDATALVEAYHSTYSDLKKPRKLCVYSRIGQVQLSLEFNGGVIKNFSVSPIQATLIMYVGGCSEISSTELATSTNLDASDVQRKMAFWVNAGVVSATAVTAGTIDELAAAVGETSVVCYRALDVPLASRAGGDDHDDMIVEGASSDHYDMSTAASQGAASVRSLEQLLALENCVCGMLSTRGSSMTLERIHTMLTMIASASTTGSKDSFKFDMNYVDLQRFLQGLVSGEKLDCIEGVYSSGVLRKR